MFGSQLREVPSSYGISLLFQAPLEGPASQTTPGLKFPIENPYFDTD